MWIKKQTNHELIKCLLIGTTNVGKSTYFNRLTWSCSSVGNIEGLTTNAIRGKLKQDKRYEIIDLPGINNMHYSSDDEATTFAYLMNSSYDYVINIVSINSLRRDLLLSLDLYEAQVLNMLNINMVDELINKRINLFAINKIFKIPINLMSAKSRTDVNQSLIPLLSNQLKKPKAFKITYNKKIEKFIEIFNKYLPEHKLAKRFLIIQALINNPIVLEYFNSVQILTIFNNLKKQLRISKKDILSIYETKKQIIDQIMNNVFINTSLVNDKNKFEKQTRLSLVLDKIFLNKYLSIPLFILIIAGIWFLTFYQYTGGWIQDKLANDGFAQLQLIIKNSIINLNDSSLQMWWANFVSEGLLGGIFTILSFIPWIIILIFCISILEQTGILSRVCIAFDEFFSKFGLSGKSIVNIITGVGCNVPSILMAKNANSNKERIIAIMVAPFINCSARIVVFGFLSQLLIDSNWTWLFNFAMMFISVIFCLFMGYFFSNFLFKKTQSFFISQIVRYHKPDLFIIVKKIINELWEFLRRVIVIVFFANLLIWLLTYLGPIKSFYINVSDINNIQHSFLRYLSIPFQIILYPLGIGQIWQLPISLITAIPAKEIAASNIDTLFNGISGFKQLLNTYNLSISMILSYLVFFSFYIPCLSTIIVMKKEIGWKYTLTNLLCSFIISWLSAWIVFNISSLIESFHNFKLKNYNGSMLCILLILIDCLLLNCLFKRYSLIKNNYVYFKISKIIFYSLIIMIFCLIIINDGLMLANKYFY